MIKKELKCMFSMMPKTATQSISKSLGMIHIHIPTAKIISPKSRICEEHIQTYWHDQRGDITRDNYATIKEMSSLWEHFFTFTFVRNPWDKMLSTYFYSKKIKKTKATTIKEFLKVNGFHKKTTTRAQHMVPTKYWVCDRKGNQKVDFVGRFENLKEDFQYICSKLDIKKKLTHKNRTLHHHYSDYYDQESIDIVADYFKWDIKNLGYDFEYEKK